jgi:cytochrome bd ubiquinol oxidase subunit I
VDNPMRIPNALSVLTSRRWIAAVRGLKDCPRAAWPDTIAVLDDSSHIIVGRGTLVIAVMALSGGFRWRRRLDATRALRWTLMLSTPCPYIAPPPAG